MPTKLITKLAINVFTLLIVAYIVPGFVLDSFWVAVVAAVVIGIVNMFIKPILQIIALPISILTLGVSALLINVALLYSVSRIVPGFHIQSFTTAFIASVVMTLVSWFLHKLMAD